MREPLPKQHYKKIGDECLQAQLCLVWEDGASLLVSVPQVLLTKKLLKNRDRHIPIDISPNRHY